MDEVCTDKNCKAHERIHKLEEERDLLKALWDHVWNGPGSLDYGDHCGYSWEDDQDRSDLASKVEDFYVREGGVTNG